MVEYGKGLRVPKCEFLFPNLGSIPIEEMQKHLADCRECGEEFDRVWQSHRAGEFYKASDWGRCLFDLGSLPRDLSRDDFLRQWGAMVAKKMESHEFHYLRLRERLRTFEGFTVLENLLRAHSNMYDLISLDAPPVILVHAVRSIANRYKDLREALGKFESATLLNRNPEDFQKILDGVEALAKRLS